MSNVVIYEKSLTPEFKIKAEVCNMKADYGFNLFWETSGSCFTNQFISTVKTQELKEFRKILKSVIKNIKVDEGVDIKTSISEKELDISIHRDPNNLTNFKLVPDCWDAGVGFDLKFRGDLDMVISLRDALKEIIKKVENL